MMPVARGCLVGLLCVVLWVACWVAAALILLDTHGSATGNVAAFAIRWVIPTLVVAGWGGWRRWAFRSRW